MRLGLASLPTATPAVAVFTAACAVPGEPGCVPSTGSTVRAGGRGARALRAELASPRRPGRGWPSEQGGSSHTDFLFSFFFSYVFP